VAVRIRLKRLGRRHRPYYRVCAMDARTARDGKVIEELGTYDPMVRDTHARAILNKERIDYWLGVGALPTEKVGVLIKKYGTGGTHLDQQQAALAELEGKRQRAQTIAAAAAKPRSAPEPEPPAAEEAPAAEAASDQPAEQPGEEAASEAPAQEPEAAQGEAEAPAEEEKKEE